jgi:FdhE protein
VGQKYLWCSTCNSQWTFTRIQCPFCLNKDQNQLRFFYDEENKSYRVYVCDNCKRYIKTIDERETEQDSDIFMTTQDMLTQYLNDLAIKDGFQNAVWWMKLDKS